MARTKVFWTIGIVHFPPPSLHLSICVLGVSCMIYTGIYSSYTNYKVERPVKNQMLLKK